MSIRTRQTTRHVRPHTIKINLALEKRIMEHLHRDLLLPMVLRLKHRIVYRNILLQVPLGQHNLLVLAPAVRTHEGPIRDRDRETREQGKEDIGLEAAAVEDGKDAFEEPGHDDNEGAEVDVAEGAVALDQTLDGRVFDRGRVGRAHGEERHRVSFRPSW